MVFPCEATAVSFSNQVKTTQITPQTSNTRSREIAIRENVS